MHSHDEAKLSQPVAKLMRVIVLGGIFWFILALFDSLFDLGSTARSQQSSTHFTFFFFAIITGIVIALNVSTLDPFHVLIGGWVVYAAVGVIFIAPDG